jgi:hypothetical protein
MIPNLFSKQKIPKKIPKEMQKVVDKVNKCKTKESALKTAYNELTKTHSGSKYGVWKHFPTLFIWNIDRLWKRKKLTCTGLTFLLRVLLVKSRHFTEKDVKQRTNLTSLICPHVFLEVDTGKKCVYADMWGKSIGIPFGKHVSQFDWFLKRK